MNYFQNKVEPVYQGNCYTIAETIYIIHSFFMPVFLNDFASFSPGYL